MASKRSAKLSVSSLVRRTSSWFLAPVPRGRIAVLRSLVYGFVIVDILLIRPWVVGHGALPQGMYEPLFFAELLRIPGPTEEYMRSLQIVLLASALLGLLNLWSRAAGVVVAVCYLQWSFVAYSYGKVDHDSIALLIALVVLPTAGRARWGDMDATESAGWAVHCIQVAVVMTYFASVIAKLRFGGANWATGSTFMRAILRRGTPIVQPLMDHPGLLRAAQFGLIVFESLTPLLLVRGRVGKIMLALALAFHIVSFAGIRIMFWPHVLCLLSFLPLERLNPRILRPAFARSQQSTSQ